MKKTKAFKAHSDGLAAETLAALILMAKGYRIAARRYKTPVGEIDLIARKGRTLVFVEVKARKVMDGALESVTPHMQARIGRAAGYFIAANPVLAGFEMRFDLLAVRLPFYWRHLDNAWRPPA